MSQRPHRVEMLLPAMHAAGMETVVATLCRGLARCGVDVGITCLEEEGALAPALRAEGMRITVVPVRGMLPNAVASRDLRAWLRERRPDVAHAHSGVWLKAARAARAAHVPRVIYTSHGLLDRTPWHHRYLMRRAVALTNRIVAVSDDLATYHIAELGARPDEVVTILNGVNTRRFHPEGRTGALRASLGLADSTPLIGIVARLAPVKDHATLIEAVALVHARRPEAVLAIVGDGPLRHPLMAQVKALGLEDVVRFAGASADMPPVYRDLDLVVLSSVAEGTSISILEAMASGRCVVGTAVGGTPLLLDHGQAGVLVPPSDPRSLATALIDLLDDPKRRQALGAAARDRAQRRFAEDIMVERYLELYGFADGATVSKELPACVE